jgi:hypothetical protein
MLHSVSIRWFNDDKRLALTEGIIKRKVFLVVQRTLKSFAYPTGKHRLSTTGGTSDGKSFFFTGQELDEVALQPLAGVLSAPHIAFNLAIERVVDRVMPIQLLADSVNSLAVLAKLDLPHVVDDSSLVLPDMLDLLAELDVKLDPDTPLREVVKFLLVEDRNVTNKTNEVHKEISSGMFDLLGRLRETFNLNDLVDEEG